MSGAVERGPHEVVHRGVHHDESSSPGLLGVEHAHQDHSRGTDQRAPRLDQQVAPERPNGAGQLRGVGGLIRRLLRRIADAKPASAIEIAER